MILYQGLRDVSSEVKLKFLRYLPEVLGNREFIIGSGHIIYGLCSSNLFLGRLKKLKRC